ncbi:unnamed protein product [Brassica rapa subsp. narinosa]
MEIGRNLGNRFLRGLDRMKTSAQVLSPKQIEPSIGKAKRLLDSTRLQARRLLRVMKSLGTCSCL